MAGIGSNLGGIGANPLSGMIAPSNSGMTSLSGMADNGFQGLGVNPDQAGGGQQNGAASVTGFAPIQPASEAQGASFGNTLKEMIVDRPSASKAYAGNLTARFAAGENIDPHQLSIASAKAGVEIQMATRTISSAVSAVRTLFQMQI